MSHYINKLLICILLLTFGCDDYGIIHIVDQADQIIIDQTLGPVNIHSSLVYSMAIGGKTM